MPPSSPRVTRQSPTVRNTKTSIWDRVGPIEFDSDGIKMLLYGESATGKSTLASTFPAPILWSVCSGSKRPGELRSINTAEMREKVRQVVLCDSNDIGELVGGVEERGYATVVLDHASGLNDLILKEILGLDHIPAQLSWGLATQQQYGQLGLQMKERLRSLLGLSCNVVIIAQQRTFGDETASELIAPTVGASLTPSVTGWLNPACDYVVQTFKRQKMVERQTKVAGRMMTQRVRAGGVEYCLRTGPDPVFMTKFRLPRGTPLPDVIVDPTYDKIAALIAGYGEGDSGDVSEQPLEEPATEATE